MIRGLFFTKVGERRRSVYQQDDGSVVLADTCSCRVEYGPSFAVVRSASCPIDEHRKLHAECAVSNGGPLLPGAERKPPEIEAA
jgi:hypothetical protein